MRVWGCQLLVQPVFSTARRGSGIAASLLPPPQAQLSVRLVGVTAARKMPLLVCPGSLGWQEW